MEVSKYSNRAYACFSSELSVPFHDEGINRNIRQPKQMIGQFLDVNVPCGYRDRMVALMRQQRKQWSAVAHAVSAFA